MDLNNKRQRRVFAVIISLIAVVLAFGAYMGNKNKFQKSLDLQFKGPVENVRRDNQGYPYVTISGKEYHLFGFIRVIDYEIQIGDTIIKEKGDLRIKI